MDRYFYRLKCAAAAALTVSILAASPAPAAFFLFSGTSSDGHAVSASADFTLGVGSVTVKLINLTAKTLDAGELFTGIDFGFGGLIPNTSISAKGIQRTIASNGTFSDTALLQNLSWSLADLSGGTYQLNFSPNSKDALVGPPTGGNYSGANPSVRGNAGHNPYAAESATFVLSVPGLTLNSPVTVKTFRFGSDLDPASGTITSTPEPATWMVWGGLCAMGAVIAYYRRSVAKC